MYPEDAVEILAYEILKKTKLNYGESYRLAVWIYYNERPKDGYLV